MSENKKKVAVIGYGGMGGWHTRHFSDSACAELAGIWDINEARCELAESRGIHAYSSLEELLGEKSFSDFSAGRSEGFMTDPQIREIVTYVLQDLTEEGKIYCRCPEGEQGEYEAEIP